MVILIVLDKLLLDLYVRPSLELALRRLVIEEFGPNVFVMDVLFTQYSQYFVNGDTKSKPARRLRTLCREFINALSEEPQRTTEFFDSNDLL